MSELKRKNPVSEEAEERKRRNVEVLMNNKKTITVGSRKSQVCTYK